MLAVRKVIRCKLSLKNNFYTSSIRYDKPKHSESVENKSKTERGGNESTSTDNRNKKKLTAEINIKNYKSLTKQSKTPKVELFSDTVDIKEKSEARKKLQALTREIENTIEVNDTPENEKLKTLAVEKPKRHKKEKVTKGLAEELVQAAKTVAFELEGDKEKTEKDILGYLQKLEKKKLRQDDDINDKKQPFTNFESDKIKEFEGKQRFAEDERKHSEHRRAQRVKYFDGIEQRQRQDVPYRRDYAGKMQRDSRITDIILHQEESSAQPLGIFKAMHSKDEGPKMKIWDQLEELELKDQTTFLPRNYFEELIQWTEEGKLWHFPIDNDQGNEAEANVDFSEHVFLEEYLETWCPKRGPLRHFMELVVTGLAKNPYFSVEEKKEHIYWYRDYFMEKRKMLEDMEALDVKVLKESAESNLKPDNPE